MEDSTQDAYHSKVKRKIIQKEFQTLDTPAEDQLNASFNDEKQGTNLWLMTLLTAILAFMAFSVVQAYLTVQSMFTVSVVLGAFLSVMLLAFVTVLCVLIFQEWQGMKTLNQISKLNTSLQVLKEKDSKAFTLKALKKRQNLQSNSPFTKALFQQFNASIREHHSNIEILQIYQDKVVHPIQEAAKTSLKKQSLSAAAIGLVSPNSFIQTLGLLWLSLRTLRSIALIYGVRPHGFGSIKLLRIALENLAAASLTDLLTDEISTQIGGTLGDKILSNSIDGVVAASLNQRLGNALIRQFNDFLN